MIVFTGHGSIYEAFAKEFDCKAISARGLDDETLIDHLTGASMIVHNAANLHPKDYADAVESNFLLTKRIVDLAYKHSENAKIVYFSSMSILKNRREHRPIEEMDNYTFSKYLGEIYCLKLPREQVFCLRCSTIFFANPEKDGLSRMIYDAVKKSDLQIVDDGVAKRDFIPIDIVAKYLKKIFDRDDLESGAYNLASGVTTSFRSVADQLNGIMSSLKVKNISIDDLPEVLDSFGTDDIERIGIVPFNLTEQIKKYAVALNNDLADL